MILKTLLFLTASVSLLAGSLDGRWSVQPVTPTEANAKGKTKSRVATLELQAKGAQLEGKLLGGKKRAETVITDGKVDGNSFSFVTKSTTKKGERTVYWKGSVEDGTLKGTHSPKQGGKGGTAFTAKKLS